MFTIFVATFKVLKFILIKQLVPANNGQQGIQNGNSRCTVIPVVNNRSFHAFLGTVPVVQVLLTVEFTETMQNAAG